MADYLYIHVPFCARKCFYCDFASFPFEEQEARSYTDALCRELAIKRNQAGELKTVYIGGGTPSLMPDRFFKDLFSCLRDNFSLSADPEITVEANPGTLNEAKLGLLLRVGVNRISIGIQSFQDTELKALGRIHTAKEAAAAVEAAQKAGFTNISLDLMYGIPGQTIASWQETLGRTESLRPAHISAYELTPEKGTPLFGLLEEEKIRLPEEGVVLGMYDYVIDYLSAHGYAQYEISNFSQPGYGCRHNINYWDRGEYLAAGAAAHSFVAGRRSRNTASIPAYVEKLLAGILPEEESTEVPEAEAKRERLFLGLRKTEGISVVTSQDGPDLVRAASGLIKEGYLELSGDHLRLTRKGTVLSNSVLVALFEKLGL